MTDPTIRLAMGNGTGSQGPEQMERALSPTIRLAHCPGAQGDNALQGKNGVEQLPDLSKPALLVSYVYLEKFLEHRHLYAYRDWALDSGAFSAHMSGAEIQLQEYIDTCKKLMAEDPTLTEIFALDVIGDPVASLKNCEEMWRQGVPAIPCYHANETVEVLKHIAASYPKIALGGIAGIYRDRKSKERFADFVFGHTWPKRIHGFGVASEHFLMKYPFHSVDATSWEVGPCKFGQWKAYGGTLSVRGSKQNLRAEVEWYLALERKVRRRWAKQMAELDAQGPTVRLADASSGRSGEASPFAKETP